jgi:hypothetical protein
MLSAGLAATTAATSAITMTTAVGLGIGGAIIAVMLILLLSSKELISSTAVNSPRVKKALNLAIIPLLAVFVLDVAFMIMM